MTHASRDTTTGLVFEKQVKAQANGIEVSKHELYRFLNRKGIEWQSFLSRKLLPDECYWDEETKTLSVFEKKYQQISGSADEKLQTCAFKIWEFSKIGEALGARKVTYTYILSSWFAQPKYKDVLDYIRTVPGCDYILKED
jgi:hypothetical protein